PYGRKLTEDEVSTLIQEHKPVAMVAGVEPLTRIVFQKAEGLKVVARCGIGMDSVDSEAADEFGISVSNTPDAPTIPVAELTIGMILALLRKLHVIDASIRSGGWDRPMGNLLHGKTVGLIGCGRIGSYVSKLLSVFGCEVLGCDPACRQNDYFCLLGVDDLLSKSDIVCLHIPYSEETHHFMNKKRILAMKENSILVNTARGGLIDEDALYNALKTGHLAGAAIDSFEQEPYTGNLREFDNVLLTAHMGSYAKEGRVLMEQQAADNMLHSLKELGVI
ncbi:phosphoglycerate dehydrogenase, partial [Candidatus Pacearchaeota archaeon]|nr:phosphoglycerate dehydrogenase [Candidatus Pacearchaeota archaeon]